MDFMLYKLQWYLPASPLTSRHDSFTNLSPVALDTAHLILGGVQTMVVGLHP